jgi:CheY-like chemotaxis protein
MENNPVDLLFTDLGMPDLTGWDVAVQSRDLQPNLPVILVTGWGHQVDPQRVQASGIFRVIAKPFRLQDIQEAVAAALDPIPQAA